MFSSRIFRTTDELDFVRGPQFAAYLRFEILVWGAIALLSLLSAVGPVFLPVPREPGQPDSTGALLAVLAFSLGALAVLIAVWRFKKWGAYVLAVWTGVLILGAIAALFSPPLDALLLLSLAGFITVRVLVLAFLIRPRWAYFQNGVF